MSLGCKGDAKNAFEGEGEGSRGYGVEAETSWVREWEADPGEGVAHCEESEAVTGCGG